MQRLLSLRGVFLIFIAACFVFNKSGYATRVVIFNVDTGLTQSTVTSVIQDSKGFLWIATQDGLNRYDGYTFKPYRNNPLDSTSLSNNNINSICEDSFGNVWLGTNNGLSMLERSSGKFINYYSKASDPSSLSDNRIFCVYRDKSGTIWVKTANSVDRFNSDKKILMSSVTDPYNPYEIKYKSTRNILKLFIQANNEHIQLEILTK